VRRKKGRAGKGKREDERSGREILVRKNSGDQVFSVLAE
jgi:hypothetical protein